MTTFGVGPEMALTYRTTVDVPARFRKSKSVGAVFSADVLQVSIGRDRLERSAQDDPRGAVLRKTSRWLSVRIILEREKINDATRVNTARYLEFLKLIGGLIPR